MAGCGITLRILYTLTIPPSINRRKVIYTCTAMRECTCTYMEVCACVCVYMYRYNICMYGHIIYIYIYVCVYVWVYICIHIYIYMCVCVCMYIYIYVCVQVHCVNSNAKGDETLIFYTCKHKQALLSVFECRPFPSPRGTCFHHE